MNGELQIIAEKLLNASSPEDVFGELSGTTADEMLKALKSKFRTLARVTHSDHYSGDDSKEKLANEKLADEAFKKLNELNEAAQEMIKNGTYGTRKKPAAKATEEPVILRTRMHEFVMTDLLQQGEFANLYVCEYIEGGSPQRAIFKVSRDPADNDLIEAEAKALKRIHADKQSEPYFAFIPNLVESFAYRDPDSSAIRKANVLNRPENLYSLTEVMQAYPQGVPPKHVAWIWRKLLIAMSLGHVNGIVHGAVVPQHIFIDPAQHGVVLTEWGYSVVEPAQTGARISVIPSAYEQWYPSEVFAKESPLPGLDIYLGAKSMIALLGGDPKTGRLPASLSLQEAQMLGAFFKGCMFLNPQKRPQDAVALGKEFIELIERLWGKRKFIPFTMPTKPQIY